MVKRSQILAMLTSTALLLASPVLPVSTSQVKADTAPATTGEPEIRNINLNLPQEDGSYAIAGI